MPRKKSKAVDDVDSEHSQQTDDAHAGASTVADTGADASLLTLHEDVSEITANISRVIDKKLSPLSELLKIHPYRRTSRRG